MQSVVVRRGASHARPFWDFVVRWFDRLQDGARCRLLMAILSNKLPAGGQRDSLERYFGVPARVVAAAREGIRRPPERVLGLMLA